MKTKLIICGLFCLLAATSVKAADNKVGIDLYESGMIGAAKAFFLDKSETTTRGSFARQKPVTIWGNVIWCWDFVILQGYTTRKG